MWYKIVVQVLSFACGCPVFPTLFIKRLYIHASFVMTYLTTNVWIYFRGFNFVPLICVSVFMPILYCLITITV